MHIHVSGASMLVIGWASLCGLSPFVSLAWTSLHGSRNVPRDEAARHFEA